MEDDDNEQPIESCCKHGIPFDDKQRDSGLQNGCDECYDEYSDSFSIVRAMEKI
jgi:hypothetical protein